jgi:hypothetical protein
MYKEREDAAPSSWWYKWRDFFVARTQMLAVLRCLTDDSLVVGVSPNEG